MNNEPMLELIELGDATTETKALKMGPIPEDDILLPRRRIED